MLQSVAALAVMTGVGHAVGWRWHNGAASALAAVGLLLLLRFAMLWVGIHLAMVAGRPELVTAVQILVWPVGFLSNVFATPASMPGWLGAVVEWNPMSATATAVRSCSATRRRHRLLGRRACPTPVGPLAVGDHRGVLPLAVGKFVRLSR